MVPLHSQNIEADSFKQWNETRWYSNAGGTSRIDYVLRPDRAYLNFSHHQIEAVGEIWRVYPVLDTLS